MKLVIDGNGSNFDARLAEFMRVTVVFAVWHYRRKVEGVTVRLDREDYGLGGRRVSCSLRADTPTGPVSAHATGTDAFEATVEAANLLEVALHRPTLTELQAPPRLAA